MPRRRKANISLFDEGETLDLQTRRKCPNCGIYVDRLFTVVRVEGGRPAFGDRARVCGLCVTDLARYGWVTNEEAAKILPPVPATWGQKPKLGRTKKQ